MADRGAGFFPVSLPNMFVGRQLGHTLPLRDFALIFTTFILYEVIGHHRSFEDLLLKNCRHCLKVVCNEMNGG